MTVEIPARRRQAYCKLVYQAAAMDLLGAGAALREIGYVTSQSDEHPERDVEFFEFLMRDTGSRDSQRADAEEFFKKRKEQKEMDKARGKETNRFMKEVPPEMFFLFRMLGLIRGLCTTLEVRLPYLEYMSAYAQKGLVLSYDRKVRYTHTHTHTHLYM
jgi:predicted unusual protein kinase regulating ubiquinone biosynthesis (AarF/ABC1/UbiB family)